MVIIMINNVKANEMVKAYNEKVKQEIQAKVTNFCDTVVNQAIIENAKIGKTDATVEVPKAIPFHKVLAYIQAQGFRAYEFGTLSVFIRW